MKQKLTNFIKQLTRDNGQTASSQAVAVSIGESQDTVAYSARVFAPSVWTDRSYNLLELQKMIDLAG